MNFNGTVKITGGEFRTWMELIIAAVEERDYDDADEQARVVSMWQGATATDMTFLPANDIYTVDAWKGNRNGRIVQADWQASDFTDSPGGGEKFDGGVRQQINTPVPLSNRVVYAAADTVIHLDVHSEVFTP